MRTKPENGISRSGWEVALAAIGAAAVLFVPIPSRLGAGAQVEWPAADTVGGALALALAVGGGWAFARRYWPRRIEDSRRLSHALLLVVVQAVLLRVTLEAGSLVEVYSWDWLPLPWLWMPWFFTSAIAFMLLGRYAGVLLSVTGVFLLYLLTDPGPFPLVGCLISSLSALSLLRRSTRKRVLRAAVVAGAMLGCVGFVQGLRTGTAVTSIAAATAAPIFSALLSAVVIFILLPVIEWMLGEISDISLTEYGSEHPLLDQLKEHAPGTWHHTLNVADLAEKAAAAIGARPLLCKTAALYHDIGKLKDPAIFAENIDGPSPHEQLEPKVSAQRIIEHVSYGLELARKHRLPRAFREIIAQHHGLTPVRYFYAKACAQLREGEDLEALRRAFSYPGPLPSSRESGIVSLADMIEAATRATDLKCDADTRAYVRKLIAERVSDGELAQCPLTLAELALAEAVFFAWVKARHHHRPAYPRTAPELGNAPEWSKAAGAAQPA